MESNLTCCNAVSACNRCRGVENVRRGRGILPRGPPVPRAPISEQSVYRSAVLLSWHRIYYEHISTMFFVHILLHFWLLIGLSLSSLYGTFHGRNMYTTCNFLLGQNDYINSFRACQRLHCAISVFHLNSNFNSSECIYNFESVVSKEHWEWVLPGTLKDCRAMFSFKEHC